MSAIWPYLLLIAMVGVLLLLLAITVGLVLGMIEQALLKRSQYLLAAIVSTLSVVLVMALFAAVTVVAVGQSEGRLQVGIAATLVGLIMLASGVRGSVQAADTIWTPSFKLARVLGGLAVFIVVAVVQPGWLEIVGVFSLSVVTRLFDLPVLGWVARFLGGLFVLWSLAELLRFASVAVATPIAMSTRDEEEA